MEQTRQNDCERAATQDGHRAGPRYLKGRSHQDWTERSNIIHDQTTHRERQIHAVWHQMFVWNTYHAPREAGGSSSIDSKKGAREKSTYTMTLLTCKESVTSPRRSRNRLLVVWQLVRSITKQKRLCLLLLIATNKTLDEERVRAGNNNQTDKKKKHIAHGPSRWCRNTQPRSLTQRSEVHGCADSLFWTYPFPQFDKNTHR